MESGALIVESSLFLTPPELLALIPDGVPAELASHALGIDIAKAADLRVLGVATIRARLAELDDGQRLIALRPLDLAVAGIVTAQIVVSSVADGDRRSAIFVGADHATQVNISQRVGGSIEISRLEPIAVSTVLSCLAGSKFVIWARVLDGASLTLAGRPMEVAVQSGAKWVTEALGPDLLAPWIVNEYDSWWHSLANV